MIVGTAGHIDHGKTTLVKALTGVDTDRLKEEKARGISIELGYAYQAVEGSDAVLGFVDVPGHERFVHTMLAGATGIDFALLVVAADDGVMPQTREHLAILDLLGLARGAVAITKCDRVDAARLAAVDAQVQALLATTSLAGSPRFAVAAPSGAGIAELRAALQGAAREHGKARSGAYFRLAVDRCFTLAGAGTVVTGTVFAGSVAVGDQLLVSPSGQAVRLRSLHAQNRPAEFGAAGQRCALNLAGAAKDEIVRGDWIVAPFLHAPSQRLDVRLRLLSQEAKPLRHWAPVHLHLGAAHVTARVALLDGEALPPGASMHAQLVLDRPLGAWHGDRFIVRDGAAARTLGGGVVLDPWGPPRHRRSPQRLAMLAALDGDDAAAALAAVLDAAPTGVDLLRFRQAWNLTADDVAAVAARRIRTAAEDTGFAAAPWQALRRQAVDGLSAYHAKTPDELGPDVARLRRIVAPRLAAGTWQALVEELLGEGLVVRSGPWLHLPAHTVELAPAEQALAARILPLLDAGGFDPPWVRDLARELREDEQRVRQLLLRLTRRGDLFQVVRDLFYGRSAVARLAAIAADLERDEQGVVAARFRDATGLGRKRAIQVLEFFDRVGYTRRARDRHRLRGDSLLQLHEERI